MIRVWIETSSAVTRAGFAALLEGDERIEIVDAPPEADVILSDEPPVAPEPRGQAPIVVVTDGPVSARGFRSGVRAILSREAAPEQIVAALHAVLTGLIAMPAESSSLVMQTGIPEAEVETLTPREMGALAGC